MHFVQVLDDCHRFDDWCAIWQNKSRNSLYCILNTMFGLTFQQASCFCSPLNRCTQRYSGSMPFKFSAILARHAVELLAKVYSLYIRYIDYIFKENYSPNQIKLIQLIVIFISMDKDCRCANTYYSNKPKLKLQSETTHNANFKPYPIQKQPEMHAPKVVQKHYDPELIQSSYKTTFTKPAPNTISQNYDQSLVNQYYQNKPKNVPFYSETEYKKSFQASNVKPQPQPAYVYKPKTTKFQGQSSYKSEFVEKSNNDLKSQAQQASLVRQYNAKRPKVAFEGSTSYKETFKDYGVKAEKQPEYRYEPKKTKFQGESSYKTAFKEMPKDTYKSGLEYCPVHPQKVAIK